MAALVVPTIFTAVDRISGVVDRMKRSVGGFAGKASIAVNSLNKGINKLIPSLGGLGGLLRNFLLYTALVGALRFAGGALVDYEKNVAHLHTILSDITQNGLKEYDKQIKATAWQTKKSAVDVSAAYANIAELNPDLSKTVAQLDQVTRASVLLSKASGIPLDEAAKTLVTIMTQYRLGADQADRIVQSLSAGNKFGAAPIDQAAEALTRFAAVARRANVSVEQSNALVQVLAAGGVQGSEAGNAIKAAITRLQRAGAGYGRDGKGNFDVGRAFNDVLTVYNKIKTAKGKDKFLFDIFGLHQLSKSGELLSSLGKFQDLTTKLTGTSEATKQASINADTFANRWDELKNRFATWLISNDSVNTGMKTLKGYLVYMADHIDGIVSGIISFGKAFLYLKGFIWATQLVLFAINVSMGIFGAVTGVANIAIGESATALAAYRITALLTTGTNAALGASTTTMATGFVAAESAAVSFFAVLAAWTIPAALVAFAGYKLYSAFVDSKKQEANLLRKENFNTKSAVGLISQFGNKKEEAGYQQWWLQQRKMGVADSLIQRDSFHKTFGNQYRTVADDLSDGLKTLGKVPVNIAQQNGVNQPGGKLDINLNDPNNRVDTLKFTGHNVDVNHIMPKLSSTTGNK